jgi:hypothetical protein
MAAGLRGLVGMKFKNAVINPSTVSALLRRT